MKLSDYVVDFLTERGMTDFFGFQGTMITHFVDSISRNSKATNHSCYNEQGAAFAASGQGKKTGECSVAYATSGPGAMNLLSGIADAYYDSAPVIFITGQLNMNEYTDFPQLRQQGYQEANIVDMARTITKYATKIEHPQEIRYAMERAYYEAMDGRKGPALIDIPMDMQRAEIDLSKCPSYEVVRASSGDEKDSAVRAIVSELGKSKRPIMVLGNGLGKSENLRAKAVESIEKLGLPVITSMMGRDILPADHDLNYGFFGAGYGQRHANIISNKKADLIISLGCRLCTRQIGINPANFAEGAKIIRVDIDPAELMRKVHDDECSFQADGSRVLEALAEQFSADGKFAQWLGVCEFIRGELVRFDKSRPESEANRCMEIISESVPDGHTVCSDVGQHQVWTCYSFNTKKNQRLLFSGGHGAMGFGLPAAIGAYYADKKRTYCICGDGSFQMNVQELQWIIRENLPITIIIFNNNSLGMIEQLQETLFKENYCGTSSTGGFASPDFAEVAAAYKIDSFRSDNPTEIGDYIRSNDDDMPHLVEFYMGESTRAFPKTVFGEPIYNQQPYIPEEMMEELLKL